VGVGVSWGGRFRRPLTGVRQVRCGELPDVRAAAQKDRCINTPRVANGSEQSLLSTHAFLSGSGKGLAQVSRGAAHRGAERSPARGWLPGGGGQVRHHAQPDRQQSNSTSNGKEYTADGGGAVHGPAADSSSRRARLLDKARSGRTKLAVRCGQWGTVPKTGVSATAAFVGGSWVGDLPHPCDMLPNLWPVFGRQ
jgi:hypothetical protein